MNTQLKNTKNLLKRLKKESSCALDLERVSALGYLIKNACGSQNAQPWRKIKEHLVSSETSQESSALTKNNFQHHVIQRSRNEIGFIGSSNKGYFVITSKSDAAVMSKWYRKRIATEEKHLKNLEQQMTSKV